MLSPEICEQELKENILPFWTNNMVDNENGGFYGQMDGDNQLHPEADKGIILNTRILWTFSAAYLKYNDPDYLVLATRAYQFILDHFIDYERGGVYWSVDFMGNMEGKKKQIYAQAFAIYAFTEYYRAAHNKQSLQLAKDLFKLVEKYSYDESQGGYLEAFNRKWKIKEDLRLSDKDQNEAKTMNTHLHILEAYTNLHKVWREEALLDKLENLIRLFLERFIDENGHFRLFFDEKWNVKSSKFSFGHDIEGGWLLHKAALISENEELIEKCEEIAIRMTKAALNGIDEDGGLMYEGNPEGILDSNKHWWPQAEAVVGLINAWQISGDEEFKTRAESVWSFIQSHIVDREFGEWHWMTNRSGGVVRKEDKAGPWKGPYHNSRAMLELMNRL